MDKEATLVTDPYHNEAGLRFPKTIDPDIVLLSHQDRTRFNTEVFGDGSYVISEPGEYEVSHIFVHGIQDVEKETDALRSVIYRIDAEDMSIAFLGRLHRKLSSAEIGELGDIDILIIPVGGGSVLDPEAAQDVMRAVEPRIVVPVYHAIKGVKEDLADVETFCKKLGACTRENVNRLKIEKKDLPQDTMHIAVIERS